VPGVASSPREAALETRAEEDEEERDERGEQEAGDLVLTAVVAPVRVVLRRRGLAARVAPGESEPCDEQEPRERAGERQEASEAVGRRRGSLRRDRATIERMADGETDAPRVRPARYLVLLCIVLRAMESA
jgi:hypothetical protein